MMRNKFKSLGKAVLGLTNRQKQGETGAAAGDAPSNATADNEGRSTSHGSPDTRVVGDLSAASPCGSSHGGDTPRSVEAPASKGTGGGVASKGMLKKAASWMTKSVPRASSITGSFVEEESGQTHKGDKWEAGSSKGADSTTGGETATMGASWKLSGGIGALVGALHEAKLQMEYMTRCTKLRGRLTSLAGEVRMTIMARAPELSALEAHAAGGEERSSGWADVEEKSAPPFLPLTPHFALSHEHRASNLSNLRKFLKALVFE